MRSPSPSKHVYLWCLFFEPHRTSLQSNEHVWLRKVTKLHPNASFTHMYVCICTCRCSQSLYPRVSNSTTAPKNKSKQKGLKYQANGYCNHIGKRWHCSFSKVRPTFPKAVHWHSALTESLQLSSACTKHVQCTSRQWHNTEGKWHKAHILCTSLPAYWKVSFPPSLFFIGLSQ
jgi:hypothetical protein